MQFLEKLSDSASTTGIRLVSAFIIIIVGYIFLKVCDHILESLMKKPKVDEIVAKYIHTLFKIIMIMIIFLMVLAQLGVDITSLVAVFTAGAAAVALALKETLTEIVNGMKILMTKPFVKDDLIQVDGTIGKIEEISLFYTFLLTTDNEKIIIPNSTMASAVIMNYSSEDIRRIQLKFYVSYDSSIDQVKSCMIEEALKHPSCFKENPPVVRITNYDHSSIEVTLRVWTVNDTLSNFDNFKWDLYESIKTRFDKEGIEIPYDQLDVHMK